jgi:rRNA-processing protein FCF1
MRKILLDTNFLLIPAQFKVDIFKEIDRIMFAKYKLYTLDKVIDELKKIIADKKQKQKDKKAAKLALQLIKAKKINIIKTKTDKPVDDIIADLKGYVIATQDIGLKRRLKAKIITLRAKKKLIIL